MRFLGTKYVQVSDSMLARLFCTGLCPDGFGQYIKEFQPKTLQIWAVRDVHDFADGGSHIVDPYDDYRARHRHRDRQTGESFGRYRAHIYASGSEREQDRRHDLRDEAARRSFHRLSSRSNRDDRRHSPGRSFPSSATTPVSDRVGTSYVNSILKCHACGAPGHKKSECPTLTKTGGSGAATTGTTDLAPNGTPKPFPRKLRQVTIDAPMSSLQGEGDYYPSSQSVRTMTVWALRMCLGATRMTMNRNSASPISICGERRSEPGIPVGYQCKSRHQYALLRS